MVVGIVDKVFGPTCRSVGLLAGRVHLTWTSRTLVGGDSWVPMSLTKEPRASSTRVLTVKICITFRLDSQAYKSTVIAKGPFFP
jgi:hypothetical protein